MSVSSMLILLVKLPKSGQQLCILSDNAMLWWRRKRQTWRDGSALLIIGEVQGGTKTIILSSQCSP